MAETVFTRADLLVAEKQQLRLLIEQQHTNPQPHSSLYSSYAPPFPIISLADDWQLNASPLPPPVSSSAASASTDDYFSNYLSDDVSTSKHFPSSFSNYSVTSDYYQSAHSSHSPPSPPSYTEKLPSYEQHFPSTHKRSHHSDVSDELPPPTKRLTVEVPHSMLSHTHTHSHKKQAGQSMTSTLQAQYPLLSSELVDGFFTSNVNVSSGVMGGLDDSELGLGFSSISRQASDVSVTDKVKVMEQQLQADDVEVEVPILPSLQLESQTSAQSQASNTSSNAASIPFQPSSLSSVLSTFSSSASSPLDNPSSLYNLTNRLVPADSKGEGQRRMKRRLTDKQRRAKIKDGLEHLRSLVALHGNASSDQASIVNSSVDLVTQLVNEREELKSQLRQCSDERAEIEREQQLALEKQRLAATVMPAAGGDKATSPDLSVLLHHLSNILSPVLGAGTAGNAAAGSEARPVTAAGSAATVGGAAGGLESLVLSQYFLHTLKLLTNLPRNTQP